MSLVKIFSVFCDAEGCSRWVAEHQEAIEARRYARRSGWKRIPGVQHGGKDNGGRDLCPLHAPASPVPTQEVNP